MRPRPRHAKAWLFTVVAAVVVWAPELPSPGGGRLDVHRPLPLLMALRVPLAVLLALVAVLLLLRAGVARIVGRASDPRDRRAVLAPLVLLVAALAAGVQIAPRALGSDPVRSSGGPGLTILSANVLRSAVRPATIAALTRSTRAEVVALPEANAVTARAYARAVGAATGRRWVASTEDWGGPDDDRSARPTSLLTDATLRAVRLPATRAAPGSHGSVRVRLTLRGGGAPMVLSVVHPLSPPLIDSPRGWRRDLDALRPRCAAGEVLVGDFNATLDHSPLRGLLDAGCTDAAAERGQGLRATWTSPLGIVRPAIDHVLMGGTWRAARTGVLQLEGSDHRAVWARVELP